MEDHDECWSCTSDLFIKVFICASIPVILMAVMALVLKLLGFCAGFTAAAAVPETASETSGLLPKDVAPVIIYGAFEEEDEESGKCSRSSSSEDLYEGHVCVICYDKKRSCFFDPCGHCATCYACAKRIVEDARTCPFCRRIIHKVRRLFSP
ncbi:PREDICTED: death-associated inhibitor of apoptosis 1-like [Ipomoea nil]|uniref:death-associated inhibitor of apoptosis 1-like n=1 Tax=Ipomoea nil TaxID=35883 RepID=UPI0009019C17|nr:PREDICTED: death-associated inhibitor of apoptosis 1-like [Ipomoea nil]